MLRRIVFLLFCNLAVLAALYVTSPLMRTVATRPDLWGDTVEVALSAAADRLAEEPHFAEGIAMIARIQDAIRTARPVGMEIEAGKDYGAATTAGESRS